MANQAYVGPLPDVRYYDPDGMSTKKREEFRRWHAAKVAEEYVFDIKKDMVSYCESDVKLLKAGCEKFVKEFRGPSKFDPMEKCLTHCVRVQPLLEEVSPRAKVRGRSALQRLEGSPTSAVQTSAAVA